MCVCACVQLRNATSVFVVHRAYQSTRCCLVKNDKLDGWRSKREGGWQKTNRHLGRKERMRKEGRRNKERQRVVKKIFSSFLYLSSLPLVLLPPPSFPKALPLSFCPPHIPPIMSWVQLSVVHPPGEDRYENTNSTSSIHTPLLLQTSITLLHMTLLWSLVSMRILPEAGEQDKANSFLYCWYLNYCIYRYLKIQTMCFIKMGIQGFVKVKIF